MDEDQHPPPPPGPGPDDGPPAAIRPLRIGVVAVQGAVSEHEVALVLAGKAEGLLVEPVTVRRVADVAGLDGIILPGGESTTIGRWLAKTGLDAEVRRLAAEGKGVMGTCAGLILLATDGDEQVARTATPLLGLLDMSVDRNAFGGQRESFQGLVDLDGIEVYLGVFIRAPAVVTTGPECRVTGRIGERIVAVRQGNIEAYAFHPELGGDLRIHQAFLRRLADAR